MNVASPAKKKKIQLENQKGRVRARESEIAKDDGSGCMNNTKSFFPQYLLQGSTFSKELLEVPVGDSEVQVADEELQAGWLLMPRKD